MIQKDREQRLAELVARWERDRAAGGQVTTQELCSDCPELQPALRKRILKQLVGKWHTARQKGQQISLDELTSDTCEHRGELDRRIKALQWMDSRLASASPTTEEVADPEERAAYISVAAYRREEKLGGGGLGLVYRAVEQDVDRTVAMKLMRDDRADDTEERSRFLVEVHQMAQLEHPGVLPIYGLGQTSDGVPFYTMRLLTEPFEAAIDRYHTSDSRLVDGRLRSHVFRDMLSQFVDVCETVEYAHQNGIVHSDLKPANVLLGEHGEAMIADWGLLVHYREYDGVQPRATGDPSAGERLPRGTPMYMSPEQSHGRPELIRPTSDVYCLGATLYHILTGRPPHEGEDLSQIIDFVVRGEIPSARQVNGDVHPALDAICSKAMALRPADRYQSAAQLAQDVENWVTFEPVSVYRDAWVERLARWSRHSSVWTRAAIAAAMIVIVTTIVVAVMLYNQRNRVAELKLTGLKILATQQAQSLEADLDTLTHDVRFLAARTSVKQLATAPDVDRGIRQDVADLFRDFMVERTTCTQVRYIASDGWEIVRAERAAPGSGEGIVIRTDRVDDLLQNKADRPYFENAITLTDGHIYLSKVDLNHDFGTQEDDHPVIRAAMRVYGDDDQPYGILVVNMHFDRLTRQISESSLEHPTMYLTNESGGFLIHPTPGIAFSFDRGLEVTLADALPELDNFLQLETTEKALRHIDPVPGLLVASPNSEERDAFLERVEAEYPAVVIHAADDEFLLIGMASEDREKLKLAIHAALGKAVGIKFVPDAEHASPQLVYARKIPVDEELDRFLCLILTLPEK